MPGGVEINDEEDGAAATSCGRVYSNSADEYYMMTAAHLFQDNCNSMAGKGAYQHLDSRDIGSVEGGNVKDDFALVGDSSFTINFTNEVMVQNDVRAQIDGAATNYEYYMDNYTTIEKTGISSGYNDGYMQKKNTGGLDCITLHDKGVQISANQADGDSGGPMYVRFTESGSEKVGIVGIATLGFDQLSTTCNGRTEYAHARGFSSDGMNDYGLVWGK
jgi:hypothetical protein